MPRARLIYNPNAGRFPPAEASNRAAAALTEMGWEVEVAPTHDADHLAELAADAARRSFDALIVAGGDGSIGRTIPGLLGSNTALGILPTGTANVMAQELGLPKISPGRPESIDENARLLAESRARSIDVGDCNGYPFLLWAGLGLDAMVVHGAEKHRSHFRKRLVVPEYALRILWYASRWPGASLRVDGPSGEIRSPIHYDGMVQVALATNIRLYAGGLATISPAAALDDGEMDLWLIKGRGASGALWNTWNIMRGRHVNDPNAQRIAFSGLRIEAAVAVDLHTDGEPRPPARQINLSVRPQALKMLIPATAPAGLVSK